MARGAEEGSEEGSLVVGRCLEDAEGIRLASAEGGSGTQGGTGFLNVQRRKESAISHNLEKVKHIQYT